MVQFDQSCKGNDTSERFTKGTNRMTTATMNPPELLTKKQVAELLQCSQRQVELLTAKGRISKPVYLGENSPRWKRAELLASLEANQAAT